MIYPQWPYVTTPRSDSGCTKYCLVVAEVASEKGEWGILFKEHLS